MQRTVQNVLKNTGIPSYFINRKNSLEFPSIVYTIIENVESNCNDLEEITEFEIYINLYAKGNFLALKEKIKNELQRNEDFYKVSIPSPIYDEELDCYIQPFQYKSFIDNL